ncbi:Class II aldolase/adducin N-terminal, partial [Trinorchestia longiramus]
HFNLAAFAVCEFCICVPCLEYESSLDGMMESSSTSQQPVLGDVETRELICELCRLFYTQGWVTGTGGGISIKNSAGDIFVAPSGVQKERIQASDLFKLNPEGDLITAPSDCALKRSQCTPLFMLAYKLRGAAAVLHSHSRHAVLATLISGSEFRVTHLEMIKVSQHLNMINEGESASRDDQGESASRDDQGHEEISKLSRCTGTSTWCLRLGFVVAAGKVHVSSSLTLSICSSSVFII